MNVFIYFFKTKIKQEPLKKVHDKNHKPQLNFIFKRNYNALKVTLYSPIP